MNRFGQFQPSQPAISADPAIERSFVTRVYTWMALALAVTGLVASATASNEAFMTQLFGTPGIMLVLVLVQLGLVIGLSAAVNRMSANVATGLFIIYAAVTGLTLSTIFLVFTLESIGTVFFVTAGTFALVSAYGYVTKTDLTRVGNLAFMALIGIILASLVNLLLRSNTLYWILTYVGVAVFVGLIAYDTQRLKQMAYGVSGDGQLQTKAAVIGALRLYLDFINLFLMLLRILGVARRR